MNNEAEQYDKLWLDVQKLNKRFTELQKLLLEVDDRADFRKLFVERNRVIRQSIINRKAMRELDPCRYEAEGHRHKFKRQPKDGHIVRSFGYGNCHNNYHGIEFTSGTILTAEMEEDIKLLFSRISPRRAAMFNAVYNQGYTNQYVGNLLGITKHSVHDSNATLRRTMKAFCDERELVRRCVDKENPTSIVDYLRKSSVFTDLQRNCAINLVCGTYRGVNDFLKSNDIQCSNRKTVQKIRGIVRRCYILGILDIFCDAIQDKPVSRLIISSYIDELSHNPAFDQTIGKMFQVRKYYANT